MYGTQTEIQDPQFPGSLENIPTQVCFQNQMRLYMHSPQFIYFLKWKVHSHLVLGTPVSSSVTRDP
jgi:hypothetical protein